ncbi:MAG TPA: hypothetical protein PLB87_03415, partial [Prolixibacteraceae bacterium]|nr:hypothetical protein [Prolixibacteraceae bacterium]
MTFDFYDIIHAVIFFQLTVLITVLLLKGWKDVSNRILAFFLFAQMMASVNAIWWNHADFFLSTSPWISHLSEPFILCWGPAMYLYVISRNSLNFKITATHLLHFLPALIMAIYLFFIFQRFPDTQKTEMIQTGSLHPKFLFANLYILVVVQVAIYNVAATIYQEKRLKNELLKNELGTEKIKWNRFILYGYFFTCIIYDISLTIVPKVLSWENIKYLSFLFFAAYFTAILYKAIVSNIFPKETATKAKRTLLLPENELQKIVNKAES